MSDFGESTEIVGELVMESAHADETKANVPRWHRRVAISTLFMALITAVGALLAGMTAHETLLDISVTLLSIGITMSGMAIIVEQKSLWYVGLVFGILGAFGVRYGILTLYF